MSERTSEAELQQLKAMIVERALPRYHHQTFNNPLREACARGEQRELQDLENHGVFGNPVQRHSDDVVIGLMWAYSVKKSKDGDYLRVRGRLALMGNDPRSEPHWPKSMPTRRWLSK